MAKDDYFVLVYKILTYLYAVLKRKISFDKNELLETILRDKIDENYLVSILKMMHDDGLVTGLSFSNVWGVEIILLNDMNEMRITSKGIEYLSDNSKMRQVQKYILSSADIFSALIKLVFPI